VLPLDSSGSLAAYAACPWTHTAACAAFGRACPTAAYAASGRASPIAAFAASGHTRTCSKADFAVACVYSIAACGASGRVCSTATCAASGRVSLLWQPVLPLNVSQSVLSLAVSACVSVLLYSSLYCPRRCLACSYMLVLQMPTAACAASILFVCKSLCCTWTCLFTRVFVLHLACVSSRALCCTWTCLSTRALCCTWMSLPTRALCCTWTCLSTRTFAAHVRVCLKEICDAPGHVCLQESSPLCNCRCWVVKKIFSLFFGLFRNRYVYFGCIDTCSKHRNKPKNIFFGFVKQTEKQPKQIDFRFFSVQTENIFCLFRGHPN
jgi:hypothetical protein